MSISIDEVKKLAELSRLEFDEAELAKMQGEINAILGYIEAVQKVPMPEGVSPNPHLALENVMREDEGAHDAGAYTADIVAQFPDKEGDFLKVKKILN